MSIVFSLANATAIQIADGTGSFYNLFPNSLTFVLDPSFSDPVTGALTTPGDPWIQWSDGSGQAYAAPYRAVVALKFPAPISSGPGSGGGQG